MGASEPAIAEGSCCDTPTATRIAHTARSSSSRQSSRPNPARRLPTSSESVAATGSAGLLQEYKLAA
jgi:hypothetical protein